MESCKKEVCSRQDEVTNMTQVSNQSSHKLDGGWNEREEAAAVLPYLPNFRQFYQQVQIVAICDLNTPKLLFNRTFV